MQELTRSNLISSRSDAGGVVVSGANVLAT
jgi:hypothetical protein